MADTVNASADAVLAQAERDAADRANADKDKANADKAAADIKAANAERERQDALDKAETERQAAEAERARQERDAAAATAAQANLDKAAADERDRLAAEEQDRKDAAAVESRTDDGKGGPSDIIAAPKAANSDPVLLALGDHAILTLGFPDEHDDELGPMPASGAGSVTTSDANIATVEIQTSRDRETQLRVDSVNPGKTQVVYREGDNELVIPVEIVRRVPKSIVVRDMNRQR